jgi:hypothetical protein
MCPNRSEPRGLKMYPTAYTDLHKRIHAGFGYVQKTCTVFLALVTKISRGWGDQLVCWSAGVVASLCCVQGHSMRNLAASWDQAGTA